MISTDEEFVKNAFQSLIERGVASEDMLTPSTVTDDELDEFEKKFDIRLPSLFREYLKAYCYDFSVISAPVPLDGIGHDRAEDEKGLCWLELLNLPHENPLGNLYASMESFRKICTDKNLVNVELTQVKNFVPIGEWGGPLCIDLNQMDARADNPATWQICRFDETVFDWKRAGYIDDRGVVTGERLLPDFKTLLEIYFCGKYDKDYEEQLKASGEEMPDYGFYIQK